MGPAPTVFVDTNILVSNMLRNILLELAAAGAIRIHWSAEVLVELRATHQQPFSIRFVVANWSLWGF